MNLGSFYVPTRVIERHPVFTREPLPDTPLPQGPGPIHVALVKIRAPQQLNMQTLEGIGLTLAQLTLLGLNSIVVVDGHEPVTSLVDAPDRHRQRKNALQQADRIVSAFGTVPGPGARRLDNLLAVTCDDMSDLNNDYLDIRVANRKQLLAPLKRGIIPVIAPIAYTTDKLRAIALNANDVVLTLTSELAGLAPPTISAEEDPVSVAERVAALQREVSVDKLILLDPLGGIPSIDRPSGSHVFVNMEQEYEDIRTELSAGDIKASSSIHLRNLSLLRTALAMLPPSASAILTAPDEAANSSRVTTSSAPEVSTRRQKNPLIHNLLTDKPIFSSSLPAGRLGPSSSTTPPTSYVPTPTTSVKRGMPLTFLPDPRIQAWSPSHQHNLTLHSPTVDLPRLVHLLQSSFSRGLNSLHYLSRINPIFAGLIIAGNYEGCALFTWEHPPGAPAGTPPVPYLDKFAVLRESQGGGKGVADMLFTAMVRTAFPEGVCWRSRRDNVVNKWYFERARGSWELPAAEEETKNWTMFWTTEGVERDRELWQRYVSVCAGVVPSWADGAAE